MSSIIGELSDYFSLTSNSSVLDPFKGVPKSGTGSGGALRVWTEFMKAEKSEPFQAPVPEGVEYLWVDKETGYLSDERCQGAIPVPFLNGSKPQYRVDCGVEPVQNNEPNPLNWFRGWFRQE